MGRHEGENKNRRRQQRIESSVVGLVGIPQDQASTAIEHPTRDSSLVLYANRELLQ